jgi:putative hydrolase of the HAD superfamily
MRNIVFDLGGVVVTWDPQGLVARLFPDPEIQSAVLEEILGHPDWVSLDRGTLPLDDAIKRAAKRTGLPHVHVARFFADIPHALVPVPEMVDLLYHLKSGGNRLFCLSNMHIASIAHLDRLYTLWEVFSGRVISCRVHLCKPEPAIYSYLLDQYTLDAAHTVFVDDMSINLTPASKLGIDTILFENPRQCEEQLRLWLTR